MFGDMLGGNKENAANQVNELVDRLKSQVGLSDDQANQVVDTIKNFVVEKYPMLQGAVGNIFGNE
jgi:polyhydroxyalkanoate synthesis regulator phasin